MKKFLLLVNVLFLVSQISFGKEISGTAFTIIKGNDVSNIVNNSSSKIADSKVNAVKERNRVWLNFTNTGGAFKQILVGYVTGATNGWDDLYDGVSLDSNPYVDFYSINSGKNLTIQGRALPFVNTDVVPLGYKTVIEGTFQISIDHVDGVLVNQDIFIEDKTTGVFHNLKNGSFSFTTSTGRFDDRFVLVYIDNTIVVTPPTINPVVTDPVVSVPPTTQEPVIVVSNPPTVIDPVVVVDPTPAVTEPVVVSEPVLAATDPIVPVPVVTDPVIVIEPSPVVTEPVPVVTDPVIVTEPSPEATAPVVVAADPIIMPVPVVTYPVIVTEPSPVVTEPVVVATDPIVPVPVVTDPVIVTEPSPVVTAPVVVAADPIEPVLVVTDPAPIVVTEPVVTSPVVTVPVEFNPTATNSNSGSFGINNIDKNGKGAIVSVNNDQIKVNAIDQTIDLVMVYDLKGKLLYQMPSVNSSELVIQNLNSSNQVLLIKTQLKNGKMLVSKTIF